MAITYKQSEGLFTKSIDQKELVTALSSTGEIYELSGVGLDIWHLLEDWVSFDDLVLELQDGYETVGEQEKEEVQSYLEELVEKKLVSRKEV